MRRTGIAIGLGLAAIISIAPARPTHATGLDELRRSLAWRESTADLLAQFAGAARPVLPPLDFGDSYATAVLPDVTVGSVRLLAFFQVDKRTGRLRRVQLERPRHAVTPAAVRDVLATLQRLYGVPDRICRTAATPASGFQAAVERVWRRGAVAVRAVVRATSIGALEGCLGGNPGLRVCGLTGQLFIRLSPLGADAAACPEATPPHPRSGRSARPASSTSPAPTTPSASSAASATASSS